MRRYDKKTKRMTFYRTVVFDQGWPLQIIDGYQCKTNRNTYGTCLSMTYKYGKDGHIQYLRRHISGRNESDVRVLRKAMKPYKGRPWKGKVYPPWPDHALFKQLYKLPELRGLPTGTSPKKWGRRR